MAFQVQLAWGLCRLVTCGAFCHFLFYSSSLFARYNFCSCAIEQLLCSCLVLSSHQFPPNERKNLQNWSVWDSIFQILPSDLMFESSNLLYIGYKGCTAVDSTPLRIHMLVVDSYEAPALCCSAAGARHQKHSIEASTAGWGVAMASTWPGPWETRLDSPYPGVSKIDVEDGPVLICLEKVVMRIDFSHTCQFLL